ncbi:hypothetical protein MHU86_21068 [Fragilaria crotonensis]|nr:hypothetical protein MHU86_21068 [Fragilaria crotonensis]
MNMNLTTIDDSQGSIRWSEDNSNASLSASFSDVINDDYLIVDGLMDDFNGLLDIDASSIFDEPEDDAHSESIDGFSASHQHLINEYRQDELMKKNAREDRSRPPSPKRRRSITCSTMDTSPTPPISPSKPTLDDLQLQYKLALEQLALSMRRSEMTRSEIVSYRKAAETKAKLEAAQAHQLKNADPFLTGSRSTLTVGLEQSRQMLRNYMNFIPTAPF